MRNGVYIIFEGHHLPLNSIRDNDEEILIRYEGSYCPFAGFYKSRHEENVYYLKKKLDEIDKAYYVKTFGLYKGYKFEVFDRPSEIGDLVRIGTRDNTAIENLKLSGDKAWGFLDINKSELEKVWEERSPVYNLPMPEGIKALEEIKSW